jgi:integrase
MATLRAMFRQAVKDELLTPTEIPAYFPMFKEPNEARGAIFIEAEWYEPLRRRLGEPLRSAFTLAYHTGIRVHELLRLRWRDVEAAKQRVVLPGEITKTGKPRSVPLPSDFKRRPGRPDELVFPLGDFRTEWYEACVTVGAGKYHCRACRAECARRVCPTHGKRTLRQLKYVGAFLRHCRHTAVRNMSDAGLPETRIMAITGHVTRSMFDRYNLKREKDVELAREAIERQHRAQQARVRRTAA